MSFEEEELSAIFLTSYQGDLVLISFVTVDVDLDLVFFRFSNVKLLFSPLSSLFGRKSPWTGPTEGVAGQAPLPRGWRCPYIVWNGCCSSLFRIPQWLIPHAEWNGNSSPWSYVIRAPASSPRSLPATLSIAHSRPPALTWGHPAGAAAGPSLLPSFLPSALVPQNFPSFASSLQWASESPFVATPFEKHLSQFTLFLYPIFLHWL